MCEKPENIEDQIPTLYQWHWDCGRMGELHGIFVLKPAEINAAIGKTVYFGEVLGKHSDVFGVLKAEDFERIDATPEFVAEFFRHFASFGYNPLDYIEEED